MSSIVYLTNKTTGIKYAYESESFRDPVTHKPKNKRKLIGKVDANGNIIPTEPHGPRRRKTTETCTSETAKPPVDEASELRQEIIQLRLQIKDLTDQNKQQERQLERLKALIASMSEVFTMRE
ncbi:MAG: DUF3450 domain-containing protein [Lachnospiraceae bacterium]|jgi:hypothetical protein|nr:DUF3450 domain-containing protein [Lachnospiraceae bacterium]MDD5847753.1 hypothetical protein [Bacillota bacterium]